ncbi:MAG: hypothetical protein AAF961_11450 [Planctomycetota bacterium]
MKGALRKYASHGKRSSPDSNGATALGVSLRASENVRDTTAVRRLIEQASAAPQGRTGVAQPLRPKVTPHYAV